MVTGRGTHERHRERQREVITAHESSLRADSSTRDGKTKTKTHKQQRKERRKVRQWGDGKATHLVSFCIFVLFLFLRRNVMCMWRTDVWVIYKKSKTRGRER